MSVLSLQLPAIASDTATAAAKVIKGVLRATIFGRKMTLKYNPASFGEFQTRSRRPRPAVCCRATTHTPSAAPSFACLAASSFVEPSESKRKIVKFNLERRVQPPDERIYFYLRSSALEFILSKASAAIPASK